LSHSEAEVRRVRLVAVNRQDRASGAAIDHLELRRRRSKDRWRYAPQFGPPAEIAALCTSTGIARRFLGAATDGIGQRPGGAAVWNEMRQRLGVETGLHQRAQLTEPTGMQRSLAKQISQQLCAAPAVDSRSRRE
jgi:hypothetical protein